MGILGTMSRALVDANGWVNLVWIDPGEHSGWCVMSVSADCLSDPHEMILDNIAHWAAGQIHGEELHQIEEALDLYRAWPDAACGTEDFILQQFRRDRTLLAPVRINAVLGYELKRGDPKRKRGVARSLFLQMPGMRLQVKRILPDTPYWLEHDPDDHGRDATAHAITFFRRAKQKPDLRHRAWPHIYDQDGDLS